MEEASTRHACSKLAGIGTFFSELRDTDGPPVADTMCRLRGSGVLRRRQGWMRRGARDRPAAVVGQCEGPTLAGRYEQLARDIDAIGICGKGGGSRRRRGVAGSRRPSLAFHNPRCSDAVPATALAGQQSVDGSKVFALAFARTKHCCGCWLRCLTKAAGECAPAKRQLVLRNA